MSLVGSDIALADLRRARCSDGAPSARNMIVTVFGDVVVLAGDDAEMTVQGLTRLLAGFDVNERSVRTSLSRIAADDLVVSRQDGRRSFYRVAPGSRDLFRAADRRIYVGPSDIAPWDGSWTIVVVDGNEATPERRADLRQQLTWAGFGTVAPNVMASPVVPVETASGVVGRVGGFDHVLVSRSTVVDGAGLLGREALARRCAVLGEVEQRYDSFVSRFEAFDDDTLNRLDGPDAFKVRALLVSTFRRIALADPRLPSELHPLDWVGERARGEASRVYSAVAGASDRYIAEVAGLAVATPPNRFRI